MIRPTQIFRVLKINYILAKHGVDRVVLSVPPLYSFRFLSWLNPWNWKGRDNHTDAARFRQALEELGPIFVKFGQLLSTRRDILPDDFADELSKLQDKVPPFPGRQAEKIVEEKLGKPVGNLFETFEPFPLASASIAQVHKARLKDGQKVVVKVLRPGIKKVIKHDVALLRAMAHLAEFFWAEGRRLHLRDIVAEFEQTIFDELDLMREGANASQLRRNFEDSELLYVPKVYWDYSDRDVLVMERVYGIPISHIETLKEKKVNLRALAERGVEIFFTQVFRDAYFHADMHPGNIFVRADDPEDPRYIAVDFGIMGALSPEDQRYLAENVLAFFKRDYRRIALLHIESGWVAKDTRVDRFEGTIRAVCEPIFAQPLCGISFGQLLLRLFQTARQFHMEVQPQLALLQKTLLHVEGMGRQLYPELDLWVTAKPFMEKWIGRQMGPRAFIQKTLEIAPTWSERMPEMPGLIYDVLQKIKSRDDVPLPPPPRTRKRGIFKGFLIGIGLGLAVCAGLAALMLPPSPHLYWTIGTSGILAFLVGILLPVPDKAAR